jgi:L-asparagine oxygenase
MTILDSQVSRSIHGAEAVGVSALATSTLDWSNWTAALNAFRGAADLDRPEVMSLARSAGRTLPSEVVEAVLAFAEQPPSSGLLLLTGVPIDQLPATPAAPRAGTNAPMGTELLLLSVARLLGQPVGYAPEHGGRIAQDIVPVQATANEQISTSSTTDLMFHTETAFHPHRPRYLLLLCLRGDEAAATTFISIDEITASLSDADVAAMRQPRFRTAVDASFLNGRPNELGAARPLLSGTPAEPTFVFDADLTIGIDDEAVALVERITRLIAEKHRGIVLHAGDLLIIDNNRAVHGRTRYQPRYDGTDRWLQRSFVVTDLAPSASDRRGRTIVTMFGVNSEAT